MSDHYVTVNHPSTEDPYADASHGWCSCGWSLYGSRREVDERVMTHHAERCGPFVCKFPDPRAHHAGDRWTCPNCGTQYRLTKPKPCRWWRNWSAPDGYWRLALREQWQFRP